MGQLIWAEGEGWNIVVSSKEKSHYFTQEEATKGGFPRTLCGQLITADVLPEDPERPVARCKKCERIRQPKLSS